MPFFDRTTEWTEEVRLSTGETVLVERAITRGPDEWFRPGRGPMDTQTLSFRWQGRSIKWEVEKAVRGAMPLALDVVNGVAIIVMPVQGARTCDAFGYPHEGMAAWREQRGKWAPIGLRALPPEMRVNLLQSYSLRTEGRVVTLEAKRELDAGSSRKQAMAVAAAALTEGEQSCKRIRPAPDLALDAAAAEVFRAEQVAGTVVAQRTVLTTTAEKVSAADLRQNLGTWREVSWIAESCREVIEVAEPRRSHVVTPTGTVNQLSGYLVKLRAGARIAFRDAAVMTIGNIACDDSLLVVVRRSASERVLVDRFDRSGRVIDATWVQLPGAAQVSTDPNAWPAVWNVAVQGNRLTIVLADYAYTGAMSQGGTLRRKAVYEARLPAI